MHISIVLLIILLCSAFIALFLYRYQGRRDIIHLDIVQFSYLFIFAPFLFVWLKSFVFVQVRAELGGSLSANEFFVLDTVVSVIALYLYGITAMKALTKSLFLKRHKDPLADLFQQTEYIHLWFSHLVMFIGVAAVLTVLAAINLFIPFQVVNSTIITIVMIALGVVFGICSYIILLLSNPKQEGYRLLKIVKLVYGVFFSFYIFSYFLISPPLATSHSFYWFCLFIFATFVVCSFSTYKSPRANSFLERVTDVFRDYSWGNNITLIKPNKQRKA